MKPAGCHDLETVVCLWRILASLFWLLWLGAMGCTNTGGRCEPLGYRGNGGPATRELKQAVVELIAKGNDAPCGRYPYMVSLRSRNNKHRCGGVLVDPLWVMTAAHCVDNTDSLGAAPRMIIGSCNLDDAIASETGVEFQVPIDTFVHENWTGDPIDGNDIALLKLRTTSKHKPILLPPKSLNVTGETVVVLGWGETEHGTRSNSLQQGTSLYVLSDSECSKDEAWGMYYKNTMVCAYGLGNGVDSCGGDSGGPLFQAWAPGGDLESGNPDGDVLVGITSFGEDGVRCGEATRPGVYTRVPAFRRWIQSIMDIGQSLFPSPSPSQLQSPLPSPELEPEREPQLDKVLMDLAGSPANESSRSIAESLISQGAKANACCDPRKGGSALHLAAIINNDAVAAALIDAGANVNAEDNDGQTPLDWAVIWQSTDVVKLLLRHGARPGSLTG